MQSKTAVTVISALALIFFMGVPATAKPKDAKHEAMHEHHHGHDHDAVAVAISLADQLLIRNYLQANYRPKCPPGLAKKGNGCLPPGIAKKYAMGKPLPPGIAYKRLPGDLLSQLTPIAGYQYVMVDKDVLLIGEATKKVIDAVTLLSAVQ
jgi:hypothetical protein